MCLEEQNQNLPSPSFLGLLFPVILSTLGRGEGGQVTEGAKRRSKERVHAPRPEGDTSLQALRREGSPHRAGEMLEAPGRASESH